jgi:hypothetical protein
MNNKQTVNFIVLLMFLIAVTAHAETQEKCTLDELKTAESWLNRSFDSTKPLQIEIPLDRKDAEQLLICAGRVQGAREHIIKELYAKFIGKKNFVDKIHDLSHIDQTITGATSFSNFCGTIRDISHVLAYMGLFDLDPKLLVYSGIICLGAHSMKPSQDALKIKDLLQQYELGNRKIKLAKKLLE